MIILTKIWRGIKKAWKWLIGLFVGTAIALTVANFAGIPPDLSQIPEDKRLKVPISDLLGSQPFTHKDKDKDRHTIPGTQKQAIHYAYRSNSQISDRPDEIVSKRTKHSRTYSADKKGVFILEVMGGEPQYYKDPLGVWWQVEYATTSLEAFNLQIGQAPLRQKVAYWFFNATHAAESIFFPDPNVESTSVDGDVELNNFVTWATGWAQATGDTVTPSGTSICAQADDEGNFYIYRLYSLFDTSALGAGVTITDAVVSYQGTGKADAGSNQSVRLVTAVPASNTDIVTGDYDKAKFGTTSLATAEITITNWSVTAPSNSFTFSSPNTDVSKTGITKIGLRLANDADGGEPIDSGFVCMASADVANTGNDPKLVVTYTAGGPATDDFIMITY